MGKLKSLWKGRFNFSREIHHLRTHAYSERQAWACFCNRLAKIHDVHPRHVMAVFDGSRDNFKIQLEIEWKEVPNE
jgi:hypothetical protein